MNKKIARDDLKDLKAKALAATPGPWDLYYRDVGERCYANVYSRQGRYGAMFGQKSNRNNSAAAQRRADLEYAAAANPAVVLDLIARVETEKQKRLIAQGMADCMGMVHQELVEAGVIDSSVPPMMVVDAVLSHIARLQCSVTSAGSDAK